MNRSIDDLNFTENKNELTIAFEKYIQELEFLIGKAEECKELLKDYDNLSDMNLYKRIKELGIDSELHKYEYASIIGLARNKEFRGPEIIRTNMKVEKEAEKISGGAIVTYTVNKPVKLEVLYANYISGDHPYTKDEIDYLIETGNLVVLSREVVENAIYYENGELCPDYGIDATRQNLYSEFTEFGGTFYKDTLKYIRLKFSKKNLKYILDKLILIIKDERRTMTSITKKFEEEEFQKRIGKLSNK